MDHQPPKVIYKTGSKNPDCITSGKKTQVTIVACVNAAGYSLPPMVIWNVKTMQGDMACGEVRGTVHAFSDNGWIDQELLDIWFHNIFLQYTSAIRPVLLLIDGHSTHYCPSTIQAAARAQAPKSSEKSLCKCDACITLCLALLLVSCSCSSKMLTEIHSLNYGSYRHV